MTLVLNTNDEIREFVKNEVLFSKEAQELLGVSKQRFSQLLKENRINSIKTVGRDSIFLKNEIEEIKVELEELRKKYRPYE